MDTEEPSLLHNYVILVKSIKNNMAEYEIIINMF